MQKTLLCILCFILFGCSISSVKLPAEYSHQFKRANKSKSIKNIEKCSFYLNEFEDARQSKSLGIVALTIVESDVEKWALSALNQYNIDNKNSVELPHVKVSLVKAYIHSMMTSMAANVVFKIEYPDTDKVLTKENETNSIVIKYVRGYEVNVNWNSGEDEILSTLNKAMSNAIAKARNELDQKLCT